jgi:[ribosomal protein S5]-alanine N-acetyltransferase
MSPPREPLPTLDLGLPGWCLRAWRSTDASSLAKHADNANVWRWMHDGFPHPYTPEAAQEWASRGHVDYGGSNWAIAFEDEAVGGCGFHPFDGALRCNAEIGWWLGEAFWGRGVGSRAARRLVAVAFEDPALTRLCATIYAGNAASMRVAERAGLSLEGISRKSVHKAGRIIDRHIYSIVRAD